MGNMQRRKGSRIERKIAEILNNNGIKCKRKDVKRGQLGSDVSYDLTIEDEYGNEGYTIEVKARANGFKQDYKWLEENTMLVKVADRKHPLVTMTLETFMEIWNGDRHNGKSKGRTTS